jgi:hypothetical protein
MELGDAREEYGVSARIGGPPGVAGPIEPAQRKEPSTRSIAAIA